jgi:citrate lyase beta subunit
MSDMIIEAPWTEDQVAALNAFQVSGVMHPFTCENDHELHQTLIAERDGWHCPDPECSFTQNWALSVMADRELVRRTRHTQAVMWGPAAYAKDPMADENRRLREELRATQDDLADTRARVGTLEQQNRALRIVLSRVTQIQKAGHSPSVPDTAGECDASWVLLDSSRHVEDNFLPEEDELDNCD